MSATRVTGTRTAAAVAAVALTVAACTPVERVAEAPPGPRLELVGALRSFAACDELLGYLRREGARVVGPYGLGGGMVAFGGRAMGVDHMAAATGHERAASPPAPLAAGEDYSGTNVQEAGVDEPDLVKTDGRLLVALVPGGLRIVDVAGDAPRLLSTLPVAGRYGSGELLLARDRVLVLHPVEAPVADVAQSPSSPDRDGLVAPGPLPASRPRAQVTVVDVADPAAPKVVAELQLDGSLVAARMAGGVARLVLRSEGPRIPFVRPSQPSRAEAATEANRRLVEASSLDDWMPGYTYSEPGGEPTSGRVGDCRQVARPREFSGLGMVSVLTVGADDPRPGPAATVVGAGELVYASAGNLYVTTTRWAEPEPGADDAARGARFVPAPTTEVHKFDVGDKVRTRYQASGSVPGRLLNQFSMSEHEGDFRVATTTDGIGPDVAERGASESQVLVLRQDGHGLDVVGSVGGLGKGEQIHAVRFLGDRGYVVTFRQTDPLYVVDLSDPGAPAVRGELKIPGYSAYLHPVGAHRLLGVGQEATEQGRPLGVQLSLFDVSDPASPRRLAQRVMGQGQSEAELDHHAFLYWARTGLAVVPFQFHGRSDVAGAFQGAAGFSVGEEAITEVGRVQHRDGSPIRRSVVVGDRVLTLSDGGLLASDLETLGERSWLAL